MSAQKLQLRKRRQVRIRAKIAGTAARPRLAVFRSNAAIYAQLIDDSVGKVIASASSIKGKSGSNVDAAKQVGAFLLKTFF